MEIKIVKKEEIDQVVTIHNKAFKDFFLTKLGDKFLWTYYYTVSHNKKGILIGCFEDNKLLGFSCATTLSKGFYKELITENILIYGFFAFKLFFTRPLSLLRLVKNISKKNKEVIDDGSYAEFLSAGVDPIMQGKGIGKKLFLDMEKRIKLEKIDKLSLTTDYHDNVIALNMYKTLDYKVMYDFVAYPDRRMYRLIKKIQQ